MSGRKAGPAGGWWIVPVGWLLAVGLACGEAFDPAASHVGFTLQTRWGQTLEGEFPRFRGEAIERDDGRRQVRLELDARAVRIVDHPGYTRFARGSGFFDADTWPHVTFESEAYDPALLREGGELGGTLRIRGIAHREVFVIQRSACADPGRACDVVATGRIRRSDYGMTHWGFALAGDVVFVLRIRLAPGRRA